MSSLIQNERRKKTVVNLKKRINKLRTKYEKIKGKPGSRKYKLTLKNLDKLLLKIENKHILKDLSIGGIFKINKEINEKIIDIYKQNKDYYLEDFFKNNSHIFTDKHLLKGNFIHTLIFDKSTSLFNLCQDSTLKDNQDGLQKLKLGHYLLLALLTETRFISAIERDNRPSLTKDNPDLSFIDILEDKHEADNVRLTSKINLDNYLHVLFNLKQGKYIEDSDYEKYKNIKDSLEKNEILQIVFGDDLGLKFKTELFDLNVLKKNIWQKFCIPLDQRRIQVLIYDIINVLAYKHVISSYKNSEEIFKKWNQYFNNFKNDRIQSLNLLLSEFLKQSTTDEHCIFLGQEIIPDYCSNLVESKVIYDISWKTGQPIPKNVKKGEKSVIIIPKNGNVVSDLDINFLKKDGQTLNADIVAAKIDNILFISVHTPTDGKSTGDIIKSIDDYFNNSEYEHIIIGIDANTKKGSFINQHTSVLRNTIESLIHSNFNLSYFSNLDINNLENGITDIDEANGFTSGALRTFIQSQYYKAMEKEESYVDFIMFKSKYSSKNKLKLIKTSVHKIINYLDKKIVSSGSLNSLLNSKNPSDHKPRSASFELSGKLYHILSHNMAGPNGSFTEYSTS